MLGSELPTWSNIRLFLWCISICHPLGHVTNHCRFSQSHTQFCSFWYISSFRKAWAANLPLSCNNVPQSCTLHSVGIPHHAPSCLPAGFGGNGGAPPPSGDPCFAPQQEDLSCWLLTSSGATLSTDKARENEVKIKISQSTLSRQPTSESGECSTRIYAS